MGNKRKKNRERVPNQATLDHSVTSYDVQGSYGEPICFTHLDHRDEVEAALIKEINELENSLERLMKALNFTERHLQEISASRLTLEHDINLKTKTLYIDEVEVGGVRSTVHIDQC